MTEKCPHADCKYSSPVPAHMQHHKSNTHGDDNDPQSEFII